ncbi:hypothetical protein Lmor_2018 [Legionella moravica]|uniref:Secreted protein n=1 Tax=Legionella moravica TaxID=39962 RepID=A0A378JUZ6_9GAMM|nr:hypothetical protein [Legionella moravica]KTD33467.1 hypothetical protein Lmor_2018 [Legionella moravica]STX61840.1 Uncharacterised protein [Legionella moravica]
MMKNKSSARKVCAIVLGVLVCSVSQAWNGGAVRVGFGGGNVHYHGEDITVYNPGGHPYPGGYPYYNRGYYYGVGPTFVVPNVIINVPVQRYYAPVCEEVEVCDSYGECWLDQYCK